MAGREPRDGKLTVYRCKGCGDPRGENRNKQPWPCNVRTEDDYSGPCAWLEGYEDEQPVEYVPVSSVPRGLPGREAIARALYEKEYLKPIGIDFRRSLHREWFLELADAVLALPPVSREGEYREALEEAREFIMRKFKHDPDTPEIVDDIDEALHARR